MTRKKWYPHHEDPDHWDHYEDDSGVNFPKKNVKPWPNQKRPPYGRQSEKDPWLAPTVTVAAGGIVLIIMIILFPVLGI